MDDTQAAAQAAKLDKTRGMAPPPEELPFEALRSTGLLWLINRSVLNPRGFHLSFAYAEGVSVDQIMRHEVEPVGWRIVGDGRSPWQPQPGESEQDAFEHVVRFLGALADPTILAYAPDVGGRLVQAKPGGGQVFEIPHPFRAAEQGSLERCATCGEDAFAKSLNDGSDIHGEVRLS